MISHPAWTTSDLTTFLVEALLILGLARLMVSVLGYFRQPAVVCVKRNPAARCTLYCWGRLYAGSAYAPQRCRACRAMLANVVRFMPGRGARLGDSRRANRIRLHPRVLRRGFSAHVRQDPNGSCHQDAACLHLATHHSTLQRTTSCRNTAAVQLFVNAVTTFESSTPPCNAAPHFTAHPMPHSTLQALQQ
jgi:hypothetical protein